MLYTKKIPLFFLRVHVTMISIVAICMLSFAFCIFHVSAAPDNELTYHGKLTDTFGVAVADGTYTFALALYDAQTGGAVLWSDTQNLTVTNGIFSTTLTGLDTLAFDQNYYLGVKIGTNAEMTPRRKVTPTGFALNAHRLNGLTADNYIDTTTTAQTKQGSLTVDNDFTVGTDEFFVNTSDNGFVGIGSTSPIERLTVDGAINLGTTTNTNSGTIRWTGTDFEGYDGSNWLSLTGTGSADFLSLADTINSYTAGSILFTSGSAVTEDKINFFWDDANNRLGLGTNTPDAMLSLFGVNNGMRFSYDALNYADLAVNSAGEFVLNASNSTESAILIGSGLAQDTSIQFDGAAHDFYTGIDNATGLYAIGVGSDVVSTTSVVGPGTVSNTAGGTAVMGIDTTFLSTFRVGDVITIDTNTVTISAIISDTEMTTDVIDTAHTDASYTFIGGTRLSVMPNGNVGIGMTNPSFRLELPNIATASGQGRANAWSTYSDSRVKDDQQEIPYGLDKLLELEPKTYIHRSSVFNDGQLVLSGDGTQTIGLIAQEVYDVIPEAVSKPVNEDMSLWSIDYDKLIPVTIKAIQEQNTLITANTSGLATKTTLQEQVNKEFTKTSALLTKLQDKLTDDVLATKENANMLANVKTRMTNIEEMHNELFNLYTLSNADRLVYTSDKGNLTIEGMINGQGMTITGDEKGAMIGFATIEKDTQETFVATTAANKNSRIFVTAKGDIITQPLAVTRIDDASGFHVSVAKVVDEALQFDWLIVDDDIERKDNTKTKDETERKNDADNDVEGQTDSVTDDSIANENNGVE